MKKSIPKFLRNQLIFFVVLLLICPGCKREVSPPDLSSCTRVEVNCERFTHGAIGYFFGYTPTLDRVLSEQEQQYVRSFNKWTVTDLKQIRTFADHIRQGRHRGRISGGFTDLVDIRCYRGRKCAASFRLHPYKSIIIANGHEFACQTGLAIMRNLAPPALKPLTDRWECAMRLSGLLLGGLKQGPVRPPCPDPNQWCDVIVQTMRRMHITDYRIDGKRRRQYPDRVIASRFTCPAIYAPTDANGVHSPLDETGSLSQAASGWLSDYAMNSNCRDGSPDDMVFLFESQPGWNQHGGPELFTFDNHDPKGGCVLLNDGTVKFVRTDEELRQLRWK
jgi:hypothetical protein